MIMFISHIQSPGYARRYSRPRYIILQQVNVSINQKKYLLILLKAIGFYESKYAFLSRDINQVTDTL